MSSFSRYREPILSWCLVWVLALVATYLPRAGIVHGKWEVESPALEHRSFSERASDMFWQWDARDHYRKIALEGHQAGSESLAFVPGWPWMLRGLRGLPLLPWIVWITLWNLLAFCAAYKVWGAIFARAGEMRGARLLAFFPTAVFFVAPYPEITFIALAGSALAGMLNERIWLFALSLALLPWIKHVGVAVGVALVFSAFVFWRRRRLALIGGLALALSFAGVLFYYARVAGDPFAFVKAQSFWHRSFGTPIDFLADLHGKPVDWALYALLALATPIFFAWRAIRGSEKPLQWTFLLFVSALLLPVLFGTSVQSIYRIVILATPSLILLTRLSQRMPSWMLWGSRVLWALLFVASTYKYCAGLHLP